MALSRVTFGVAIASDDYSTHGFVRNAGQYRTDVAFMASLRSGQVFALKDGRILHALPIERRKPDKMSAWVVLEKLDDSKVSPRSAQVAPQRLTWVHTGATSAIEHETYSSLDWPEAWPGITMRLQVVGDRTERVFRVSPGADPRRISLGYDGAHFELDSRGGLVAPTGKGQLLLSKPLAFQDTPRGRAAVDVRYVVSANGSHVAFEVGKYDRRLPLTIDPVLQSTYFGFGGASSIASIAIDQSTGDVIAGGSSAGLGVPGVAGGFQTLHVNLQVFVTRIDAKLQRVIQSTYFGSGGPMSVDAVAVHPQSGEIYVSGFAQDSVVPGTGGGAHPVSGASRSDGYIVRFSPDLRQVRQATYMNQSGKFVNARALAINATTGDVYAAGEGGATGYLLRYNRQLTAQLSRVAFDSVAPSRAFSVAINQATGDVYLGGGTTATVLPQIAGGAQTTRGTGTEGDGYVARFTADLGQHLQSTFLSEVESGQQVFSGRESPQLAVNPVSGEVIVASQTAWQSMPAAGGAQTAFGGGVTDIAITRVSADLRQRLGSTYFGGASDEELGAIAFTPDGASLYVVGTTFSRNLPGLAGGAQPATTETPSGYIARFSASLATLDQSTYFSSTVAHVFGSAVGIQPSSGEIVFGGQCREGIHEIQGALQMDYLGGLTSFGTACLARFDAALSGASDLDPDAFSFVDQTATAPGVDVTSNPARIEGITGPVTASVTNGTFSVDFGAFDSTPRTVSRGQSIRVQHTSSVTAGVAINSVLTVGSRSDTFTSVTATGVDSTPTALSIPPRNPVAMDIDIESAPVTVAGIDAPASISIANGEYSLDGGLFTAVAGTINGSQSVVVRHHTATAVGTVTQSTLTIGGVSAVFSSTTDAADSSVHPFQFADVANMTPDFDAQSDSIRIIGINVPVPVSATNAEWSTDGTTWHSGPGTVTNLSFISLRRRSGAAGVTVSATLTVGDQSDDWVMRQPQAGDTTPDAFAFTTVTNAQLFTNVVSNDIVVSGVDVPVWVTATSGEFFDPVTGDYVSSGYLGNGATTRLRVTTGHFAGDAEYARLRIGTVESTWEVRNLGGDSAPDAFSFTDQTGVVAGSQVTSNEITVAGLVGDATATVTGCEMSVNAGSYGSSAVHVINADRIKLRVNASASAGTAVTCSLAIGGVSDEFRVTTAGTAGSGGGSSGVGNSGGGKGGGGTWDWLSLCALGLLAARRFRTHPVRRLA